MNYTDRLSRLSQRRNSDVVTDSMNFSLEECLRNSFTEKERALNYAKESMLPLPKRSTEISYEEGERVKNHLENELSSYGFGAEYEFQGSVTCNTHIKYHSDIDLLVVIDRFSTYENPNRVKYPYQGNVIDDLSSLKKACNEILKNAYPAASVELNSKSIKLSGGSLRRNIDVVPSNWYKSEVFIESGKNDDYRGIQILDEKTRLRNTNYPFLNRKLVNEKDLNCARAYRPIVRLAKTLKEDSELEIDISSYDIQAIFYNMYDNLFITAHNDIVSLIQNARDYLGTLLNNPRYFAELMVPDKTRKICEKTLLTDVEKLFNEFSALLFNIQH